MTWTELKSSNAAYLRLAKKATADAPSTILSTLETSTSGGGGLTIPR